LNNHSHKNILKLIYLNHFNEIGRSWLGCKASFALGRRGASTGKLVPQQHRPLCCVSFCGMLRHNER